MQVTKVKDIMRFLVLLICLMGSNAWYSPAGGQKTKAET
jgi:hypothetical protein